MARVICVGYVNWDVTLRVDRLSEPDGESVIEERQSAGEGSAANVVVGLVDHHSITIQDRRYGANPQPNCSESPAAGEPPGTWRLGGAAGSG